MSSMLRTGVIAALAAGAAAAPASGQTPAATGVVVVRAADSAGAAAGETGLGFVAGEAQVIARVDPDATGFVVSDAGGTDHQATLVAADEASGLALLAVAGLAAPPYPFARDPAEAADEVHGAARDAGSGTVTLVSGRVLAVEPGAAAAAPDVVRHDAFDAGRRNAGAPLLNTCGEVVGVAIDDDADPPAPGSGLAAPGAWALARFAAEGLDAAAVDTPCLTLAERTEAAEAAAADAARRAEAAETEAADATERAAAAETEAADATERAAAAEAMSEEARQAAAAAADAQAEAQRQAAADRTYYMRWAGAAGALAAAVVLVFWVVNRRSVGQARQDRVEAETLAWAATTDLEERDARERLARAVPAVFLDGADADGHRIGLRVPGRAIADGEGAVVGRNPFESAVVLDHDDVSRRHFRLFARETAVLVEDLHSLNGTALDDVPLAPGAAAPVRHGAVLRVGGLTFTVTLDAGDAGRAADGED